MLCLIVFLNAVNLPCFKDQGSLLKPQIQTAVMISLLNIVIVQSDGMLYSTIWRNLYKSSQIRNVII